MVWHWLLWWNKCIFCKLNLHLFLINVYFKLTTNLCVFWDFIDLEKAFIGSIYASLFATSTLPSQVKLMKKIDQAWSFQISLGFNHANAWFFGSFFCRQNPDFSWSITSSWRQEFLKRAFRVFSSNQPRHMVASWRHEMDSKENNHPIIMNIWKRSIKIHVWSMRIYFCREDISLKRNMFAKNMELFNSLGRLTSEEP